MPNFRSIGPFKQKLQRGGSESALPRPYQSAKNPACLGLKFVKALLFRSFHETYALTAFCFTFICGSVHLTMVSGGAGNQMRSAYKKE